MVRTGLRLFEQAAPSVFEVLLDQGMGRLSAFLTAAVDREGRLRPVGPRSGYGDRRSGRLRDDRPP